MDTAETSQLHPISPLERDWRTLPAALAFLMTRSQEFADEVERDTCAGRCIELTLTLRLVWRDKHDRLPLRIYESCKQAWARLQALIEDSKIPARGTAVDRYRTGPRGGHDITHTHGVLPPEQVGGLVLWDEPSIGDTWLRPNDPTIFGQGRHWKSVEIHWPKFLKALKAKSRPSRKRGYRGARIRNAFNAMVAEGHAPDALLALMPKEFMSTLTAKMGSKNVPDVTSFGKVLRALQEERGLR